jgi:hypothetical protein
MRKPEVHFGEGAKMNPRLKHRDWRRDHIWQEGHAELYQISIYALFTHGIFISTIL